MTANSDSGLQDRIDRIFVDLFELEKNDLSPEKHLFQDLGLDSLDTIDLLVAFQKEFKIKAPNADLQDIRTLEDVYKLVVKYLPPREKGGFHEEVPKHSEAQS